jgi:UDP-3-O-[3-hydroxymyristoyl] glucosamine N-acyltransferase
MADPRFFIKSGVLRLGALAEKTGSRLSKNADPDKIIHDVASLSSATSETVSFFDNAKYKESFLTSKAGACFVSEKNAAIAPSGMTLLISSAPYMAYARAAALFYPEPWPQAEISAQAIIAPTTKIAEGVCIEAGAIVQDGAEIGSGSWIESGAVIGRNVVIGENCRIGVNASLSHCLIGNGVRLYTGVRVGQDGFGFASSAQGHVKVPQLGRVIIEDFCEIGANTTIDRGAGPDTVIGKGSWIDNLVQIGHNVKMGKGCIIVSQVGISGSTELGDFVAMGGQSGAAGHLKIATGARVAAQSGLMRNVDAGSEVMGSPAVPIKQFMRQVAALAKLTKK